MRLEEKIMEKCMKICRSKKCLIKTPQPLTNFFKSKRYKDGLDNRCKVCRSKSVKESIGKKEEYYLQQSKERMKRLREENPQKYKNRSNKSSKELREKGYFKDYYQKNKEKINEYEREYRKERYWNNIEYRLKTINKSNFTLFFKDKGERKNLSFTKLIDYTYEEFKIHLENNFREGMSWDNFGKLWEIHHIKPQSLFSCKNIDDIKMCWRKENMIPLWDTTLTSQKMGDDVIGNRNVEKDRIYHPKFGYLSESSYIDVVI